MKGASLENTEWAFGLCVYTGQETKIMKNLQQGRNKMSHLERCINQLVIGIVIFQIVICTVLSILCRVWFSANVWDDGFLNFPSLSDNYMSTITFFTYFLLTNTFLPISLPVQLEVTKVV